MQDPAIIGPVLATVALTFAVWVYMFARRIPWIQANEISPVDRSDADR